MIPTGKIAEDLEDIRAALAGRQAPFFSSLLARARVIATTEVERAAVDDRTWMYINPKWWAERNFIEKVYVSSHEVSHVCGYHPLREKGKVPNPKKSPADHKIFNAAADSVVFTMLKSLIRCPPLEKDCISAGWVSEKTEVPAEDIEKMTVEEIFDLLKKHVKVVDVGITIDVIPGHGPKGTVVQEGHPIFREGVPDKVKEAWKDFVTRAYMTQRAAGTVPAGIERFVNGLIKPRLDPRSIIRNAVRTGLGKMIVSDWKKKSRRYPDALPGIKRLTVPTIWNWIDASGSITENDIKLELGTTYEFSRHAKIVAGSFDAEAYELVSGKRPSDVIAKIAKKIRGGGGTEIRKVLEITFKQMRYKDIVFILTDGHIFDLETEPVKQLLAQVAHRASVCAFLTIDKENNIPPWRSIKLRAR
jgi:predicted metal-dependent peptidase